MLRQKLLSTVTALMLLITSINAQAAMPNIYSMAPDGALAIIAVPSLNNVQTKIANIDKQLGLGLPPLQNILPMLKMQLGMQQGIDDNGGILFAVTGMPAPGEPEPPAVILVPVNNYKAFLGNFNAEDNGGITEFVLQGKVAYAKSIPGYAVMGTSQPAVNAYTKPAANNLNQVAGPFGSASLERSDIALYINMGKLGPMLSPMVQFGLMGMMQELENAALPPEQLEMTKAVFKLYGAMLNAVMNDAQSMTIGFDVSDKGIGFSTTTQFKAGSSLGEAFAKAPAAKLKFDRLPNRPYLILASSDLSTLPIQKWANSAKQLMGNDAWSTIMKSSFDMMGKQSTMQMAYYTPGANGPVTSFLTGVSVIPTDNPDAYINDMQKMMTNLTDVPDSMLTYNFKKNALELDGQQVHQYSMKTNFPPEVAAQMGPFLDMLGTQSGYIAKSKSGIVTTVGADPTLLREALKTAEGGSKLGNNEGVMNISKQLGPDRVTEMYINVGELGKMVLGFVRMFNPQINVQLPQNMDPIGVGVSAGHNGMATRAFIPMSIIKTTSDMVMKLNPAARRVGGAGGGAARPAPSTTESISDNIKELNTNNFSQATASGVTVVEYYATWSSKSREQGKAMVTVADDLSGKVNFARVDIDKNAKIAREQGVAVLPTIIIYKDGKLHRKLRNLNSPQQIKQAIAEAQ